MSNSDRTPQRNDLLAGSIEAKFGSQAAFARKLGVGEAQVSKWVKGQITPRRARQKEIARKLGVDRESLWPKENPRA